MKRLRVQLAELWRYGSFATRWNAKDPYRTTPRPEVEPHGFRCTPKAFAILVAVVAVLSLIDLMRAA